MVGREEDVQMLEEKKQIYLKSFGRDHHRRKGFRGEVPFPSESYMGLRVTK